MRLRQTPRMCRYRLTHHGPIAAEHALEVTLEALGGGGPRLGLLLHGQLQPHLPFFQQRQVHLTSADAPRDVAAHKVVVPARKRASGALGLWRMRCGSCGADPSPLHDAYDEVGGRYALRALRLQEPADIS